MTFESWSEAYDVNVILKGECTTFSYSLHLDQLYISVFINYDLLQKEASLMRAERCTNLFF